MKKILWATGLSGGIVYCCFLLINYTSLFARSAEYPLMDSLRCSESRAPQPLFLFGVRVDNRIVERDVVRKNQIFSDLIGRYFVSPSVLQQVALLSPTIFNFRKISAGGKYTAIVERDCSQALTAFVYEPNPVDYVVFHFKDSLTVETCQREVKIQQKNVSGEIQSSLSETIEELGISRDLTNKFVDIFGWQVDFQRLQVGDKFKLIYEEITVDDQPIGTGKILGIYFEQFGHRYYAFPFDQGDGLDYFDEEGRSLRKALLKYPIEFTRISSRYNLNRFHPILKVFKAHLGTDFSAAEGTPIRTVGDGIVEEAQYKGGNGNYVKIRHNATYSTAYLHMSKIAAGMVPGTRVKQGQTIGFVGSTGWATGPHVCYRFWRNGVQVDALNVQLPPSLPVKNEYQEEFRKVKEELVKRLQLISFPSTSPQVVVAAR